MDKGRTEDQGKSPADEHRHSGGTDGEGGGTGGAMPSNEDEERLFPLGRQLDELIGSGS